ncbi:MAG: hypothetical protein HY005_01275 [Candidatus Staskawiczbacteria bacterium]|nr:hypothetical protein [Candidatus Staskawiczbacteria bacterium]MBI3337238.1 hypothetical protein [Candidatus Staskawiczbacteria bacterium]
MKIYIIGSIKINSWHRKIIFINGLRSLNSVSSLFYWNFNIVGKYAKSCRKEILKHYNDALITNNNNSTYYEIVKEQVSRIDKSRNNPLLFFFMEDHWFVCPHKNLFFYLLEEFYNSKSDVLRITHLREFWRREHEYTLMANKPLYKEYLTDSSALKNLWRNYPGGYIVSLPGIFKKEFAVELLENNKSLLNSKKPGGFELYGKKAEEFLAKRSFITMVPTVHVLREVFWINQDERAIDVKKALKIITLRDTPDSAIKLWRRIIRLIMAPRTLLGRIKRSIQK